LQRILVVDDERNIRNILDFSLGAEGYQVIAASDGNEALALAQSELPDLIILDVMMPQSDGFEVCRQLKRISSTASIPVILLTAKNSKDDRQRGDEVQADAYFTKPFSPIRLIDTVQSLLGVPKG
jgi:two-component system alkaline phosphatase synthesis response regulator PhoP